jgi:hypothetical protein
VQVALRGRYLGVSKSLLYHLEVCATGEQR